MAQILPFRPYRYTPEAGDIADLVTQPYDKISPEMRAAYLERSEHNFVRIILGEKSESDDETNNVYTRAADHVNSWVERGLLAQDAEPGFYPYFQEFEAPDSGKRVTRKGFICLGPAEDYSTGVVHPHEQTLRGPKQDRLELLRHTKCHFGQLFLLYSDPACAVDALLEEAAQVKPLAEVSDEYGVTHRIWKISDPAKTAEVTRLMADKKLLIADGHHRFETACAFGKENPDLKAAQHVMMTLVNMDSPGLEILATHRVLNNLPFFDGKALAAKAAGEFQVTSLSGVEELKKRLSPAEPGKVRIAFAYGDGPEFCLLETDRGEGGLDVRVLHERILGGLMDISQEDVREQKFIRYVRGQEAAVDLVRQGAAQVAFLLEPTSVKQVADVSFSGGVMPQKSTDFYPKLLSGLAFHKMED